MNTLAPQDQQVLNEMLHAPNSLEAFNVLRLKTNDFKQFEGIRRVYEEEMRLLGEAASTPAVSLEGDITVCGQCGSKNRQKAHEVGQALVCGNCKAPLGPEQNQVEINNILASTVETKPGYNEKLLFECPEHNWVVTRELICTSTDTFRISEIQRVEIRDYEQNTRASIGGFVAASLLLLALIIWIWNCFVTHTELITNLILLSIPGLLVGYYFWYMPSNLYVVLVAHYSNRVTEICRVYYLSAAE